SSSPRQGDESGQMDRAALFIKGVAERSPSINREVAGEKPAESLSVGSQPVISKPPTSSGAIPDTGTSGASNSPVMVSVPVIIKWGVQKQ
ncbi:MAG: hypothetical protein ACKN9V_08185, partial [Pseudomonadota bacterium]